MFASIYCDPKLDSNPLRSCLCIIWRPASVDSLMQNEAKLEPISINELDFISFYFNLCKISISGNFAAYKIVRISTHSRKLKLILVGRFDPPLMTSSRSVNGIRTN